METTLLFGKNRAKFPLSPLVLGLEAAACFPDRRMKRTMVERRERWR